MRITMHRSWSVGCSCQGVPEEEIPRLVDQLVTHLNLDEYANRCTRMPTTPI